MLALTCQVYLIGTFARFWSVWGSKLAAWLTAGDEDQAGGGAAVTEQQQPPLPSSSAEADCSCSGIKLPSAFQLLSHVTPIPRQPGAYWGWVGSMKEADNFVTALENETNTSFSVETSRPLKGEVVQRLNCRAGGKESWLVRSKRKGQECTKRPNAAGLSRKGRCSAHITLRIPLGMAQAAGLGLAVQHGNAAAASSPSAAGLGLAGQHGNAAAASSPSASLAPPASPSASKQLLLELHLQHVGHTLGSKADVAMLPMDPRLRDFITPMAVLGTPAKFLQPLVQAEGRKLSVADGHTNVDECNTRYFPTARAISNQVRKAIISGQLHAVDQEAVSRFAEERRAVGDSCYFRPHVPGSSKLLLVHQSEHQQYIMKLYGQTIIGMDATYKTNQHGYPFFLFTVVDNHRHSYPVAMAVVEDEAGETVAEALQQLRLMNPGWQPQYVMMDKS